MNIKEGDPILSPDGETILAYWAVSIDNPTCADAYSFPVLNSMNAAQKFYEQTDVFELPPMATIVLHVAMPDKTYWRVTGGSPDGWQHDRRFRPAPATPSGSPAGMVAAYDLVLGDASLERFIDPQSMQALEHGRGYWKSRANREACQ